MLTEQEFAKNVVKTAEAAKANVTQQVRPCLFDTDVRKCFITETDCHSTIECGAFTSFITESCLNVFFPVQEMMPLQYIYTMALEQDIKNSVTSKRTSELLHNRCYQV